MKLARGAGHAITPDDDTAVALARGVIHAMTTFKVKVLGAALLVGILALGGLRTLVRPHGATGLQDRAESRPDQPADALNRSVEKLQSELDESARRNAEMRKTLQEKRSDLKAPRVGQQPPPVKGAATRLAEGIESETARAVGRLADAMKRHPPRPSADRGWNYQTYMLDLVEVGMTLIIDEPRPDQICSGLAVWSHDGNRIVFDTTGVQWPLARLMAIEARDGRPTFTDLGAGNHPTFSPDDKRIAFQLHPGAEPGAEPGIWVMQADGSGRRRVGEFGAPFWSPDGREFLINSDSDLPESIVINLQTRQAGVVKVPGHQVFSWPSWADPGTLVSALATDGKADSIALLDVRKPDEAKIIKVLWKRGEDLDVTPRWPVYRPDTRRCYFVGAEPRMRSLYTVRRGESLRARPMQVVEDYRRGMRDPKLGGLSFSPDGRYLLFQANRPARE